MLLRINSNLKPFSLFLAKLFVTLGTAQNLPRAMNRNCLDVPEMWSIMPSSYTSVCWRALSTADWVQLNSYNYFSKYSFTIHFKHNEKPVIPRILLIIHRGREAFHNQGWKGLVGIIRRNLYRLIPFAHKPRVPPSSPRFTPLPCTLKNHHPQKIICHIDAPKTEVWETDNVMPLVGWAWSSCGIKTVSIFINNELAVHTTPTIKRPDVTEKHPELKDINTQGFAESLNFANRPYANYEVAIVIRDKKKNVKILKKIISRVPELEAYHNYYFASLLKAELTIPKQPADNEHICIWLDTASQNIDAIDATVKSICAQSYKNWTCVIIDNESGRNSHKINIPTDPSVSSKFSFAYDINLDNRADHNAHLSGFLRAGEILSPSCLQEFAQTSKSAPQPDIIYADSDHIDKNGLHCEHHFKPDWSSDYLWADNYIGDFYLVRKTIMIGLSKKLIRDSPAWRYKLLLRLTQSNQEVRHIAKPLWSAPLAQASDQTLTIAEHQAAREILAEQKLEAQISPIINSRIRKISWPMTGTPKVSIIIPTTGNMAHLRPCVESLADKTNYPNFELVFIDNGRGAYPDGIKYLQIRDFKVIKCWEPFNWSRLNNLGVGKTNGELLLFLNDDVEAIDNNWLNEMVSQALRPEVGTVGSLLLYPNGSIQHAGIFLVDHGGGARHYLQGLTPGNSIYQELHQVAREVSACTGACLMIRRSVFEELNGFDEDLAIVGNDVDLCLRAIDAGYKNIFTPHCRMLHHESVSRKKSNIDADEKKMWNRWRDKFMAGDPYYNQNLVQDRMDHSLESSLLIEPLPPAISIPMHVRNRGVNIIGYVKSEMGVGEAARGLAKAIQLSGTPFTIIDYELNNPSRQQDTTWDHRLSDLPAFNINLFHINADVLPAACEQLGAKFFDDHYNIAFWAWELSDFPDIWQSSFDLINEIWVPSDFVRKAIAKKSPHPVHCFPHPVAKGPGPYLERQYFGLPKTPFLFLSMYDLWSIRERKNPQGSIMAFKKAFAPDDFNTGLVLKVNNADKTELKALKELVGDYKNIYIIDRILSRYEVDSLIFNCNCLVSLHRSEGFGLVMAEAMAMGRPVIATGWSGNMEFMNESNSACVQYELVRLNRDYGPYQANQYWAEPNINHASWWMKKFADNPDNANNMGLVGQQDINKKLSPLIIGNNIKKRLSKLKRLTT